MQIEIDIALVKLLASLSVSINIIDTIQEVKVGLANPVQFKLRLDIAIFSG